MARNASAKFLYFFLIPLYSLNKGGLVFETEKYQIIFCLGGNRLGEDEKCSDGCNMLPVSTHFSTCPRFVFAETIVDYAPEMIAWILAKHLPSLEVTRSLCKTGA